MSGADDMINLIFTIQFKVPLTPDQESSLLDRTANWVRDLPEMRTLNGITPIQLSVDSREEMIRLKNLLDPLDNRLAIQLIGVWNEDGTQDSQFPFDASAYRELLNDIVLTVDINGNPLTTRRPTVLEAQTTAVNKFFGWADRVLA